MKKSKFKKFITTNSMLKLTSLVLAVVLWFFVVSKGRSVVDMDVPVGFKNIPANLEVMVSPETVNVGIEGHKSILKKLRQEDIPVIIDLSNFKEGKTSFMLTTEENIELQKSVIVNRISPQTVKLLIKEKMQEGMSE